MDEHLAEGLDKSHAAWGDRFTRFQVQANPVHVPVTLSIGDGQMSVSAPRGQADGLATRLHVEWGLGSHPLTLDLSREDEFWIDLRVQKPDGRFADLWSIRAIDSEGKFGINDGWIFRTGGIRFRRTGFTGDLDWTAIRYLAFTQDFDSQGGTHPESYSVTKIYTVPEPSLALLALFALAPLSRAKAKQAQ